ncbi:hypothetical protein HYALB_00008164 [Hymenoscyphus albidus]|uniref:Fungal N-terminal domain-containing protein n=1 Tax=Hymenoscyphus albidus TaxID=595503 RepID=A0A9N9M2I1_9HELO|nr:hypothetical protein HYALB_00008164 [Hymenoscyphus albidus]
MDPLSITSTVASIVGICLKTAKSLSDLRDKYKDAEMTILAIHSETSVIGATLSKIQCLLLTNPEALSPKIQEDPGIEVKATFDVALTGCAMIYSCIEIEVGRLRSYAAESDHPSWKAKSKFLWNEDTMNLYSIDIDKTSETSADIHRIVKEKNTEDVLESAAVRTRTLRDAYPQSKAPASIFDTHQLEDTRFGDGAFILGSATFGFDDAIINSHVYRRTLADATQYGKNQSDLSPTSSDAGSALNTQGDEISIGSEVRRKKSGSSLQVPNEISRQRNSTLSSTAAMRACSGSVMGPWAKYTTRKFRTRQLRFEVVFETPVLSCCPTTNATGPIQKRPIHYIDGTNSFYNDTRSSHEILQPDKSFMYSADDELASWVKLLSSLQMIEKDSRSKLSYIPNPTTDPWNLRNRFGDNRSIKRVLEQLQRRLIPRVTGGAEDKHNIRFLGLPQILMRLNNDDTQFNAGTFTLEARDRLQRFILEIDTALKNFQQTEVLEVISGHINTMVLDITNPTDIRPSVSKSGHKPLSDETKVQKDIIWKTLMIRMFVGCHYMISMRGTS